MFEKKEKTTDKNKHYITANIAKQNLRTIKQLKKKRAAYTKDDYITEMKDDRNVVEFDDLHTYFFTDNGVVKAVNGVSFDIPQGSTVGVVGESGCGKSVTSLSLMQLVQGPMGQIVDGSIRFRSTQRKVVGTEEITEPVLDENGNQMLDENGEPMVKPSLDKHGKVRHRKIFEESEVVYDIAKTPISEMSKIRGREIAMIFQEPMTSLNPVFTIGNQLDEVTLLHVDGADKQTAKEKSIEMLKLVGIAMPEHVYKSYPHELSGGMRQRVMIAMALCCNPKLIIADEPTTALDVTIQAQILKLIKDLQKEFNYTIVFITHDLGVVANVADRVAVLYAGQIVELGTVDEVFYDPRHPYTWALLSSLPQLAEKNTELYSISGTPPSLYNKIIGDPFAPRNPYCLKVDTLKEAPMFQVTETHFAKTWLLDPRAPKIEKPEIIKDIHGRLLKAFNIEEVE